VSQLHGFAAGHRSKASPELIDAMGKLSSDDVLAVADFLSRLPQSAGAAYGEAP
jgi:cytochrome c553